MKISTTTAAAAATATTATAATHGRVKRLKKLRALPPPSSSSSSPPPPVPHRRRRTITQVTVTLVVLTMLCLWTGLGFLAFFRYAPSTATRMVGSLDCTFASSSPFSSITSRYTQQQTPPPPYNLSHPHPVSSTSPFNMFHTVTSRFMVGQPNQPTLARARYRLLETFCFPTMLGQTRQNFFWLVLVDPRIDGDVLRDIQTLLSSMPTQNAFMVLTQNPDWAADGVGVPGVESYGVGLQELGREYEAGRVDITSGNTTFLLQALDVIEDRHRRRRPNQVRRRSSPQSRDMSSLSLILLLETLLDADDGMHTSGIQRIQDTATQHTIRQLELMDPYNVFEPTTKVKATTTTTIKTSSDTLYATDDPISLNETWWLMCGTDHIEWHNRDIYQLTLKEYQEKGLSSGITGLRHAPVYCASAGYTRVGLTRPALSSYLPSHQRKDDQGREPTSRPENDGTDDGINNSNNKVPLLKFPRVAYSNHALTAEFAVCNDGLDSLEGTAGRSTINNNKLTTGLPFLTNEKGDEIRNGKNNHELISSKCFRRVFPNFPFVLKSRTITSDSMDHISVKQTDYRDLPWQDPSSSEYPLLINETEKTWQVLESDFNISRMKAWQTSLYLREHMEEILDENSKGRCAPGFPCREVANVQFKKIGMFVRGMKRKDAYEAQHKTIKAKKQ